MPFSGREPTMAEVGDRLQEILQRLDSIAESHVRTDLYAEQRANDRAEVRRLDQDVTALKERVTYAWRVTLTSFVFPIALAILMMVLTRSLGK